MLPGHVPRRMPKSPQKFPLCIFLIQDGRHHVTHLKKTQGYTLIPHFCSWKKIFRCICLCFKAQIVHPDDQTFLNTTNPGWPPYYFVKQSLEKTKICVNYLVVETKMYFSAEPMESRTYLDNQYFITLSLST